ncbi:clamp loader subunit [Citrobacter phage Merlin]|uniref:Sliding-clamp-loader small subunit n=1 Tax=Citrobacter phage Merlin TaxID=1675602 RepID=A0A0K1LME3_9CAUD|nr:clamp loader subunit [Citrobacter phage Merlin]AKU43697.1 clamp loader subunit [Citrobacter phage Merlin]
MSLFDDDVQLNEHQVAWYSKDWTEVQKVSDQFKQTAENEFFEIIGAINEKKPCSIAQKNYSRHMVENALSQHPECMPAVYVMNLVGSELSDEDHFNYMMAAIPQGRRYGKWAKLIEDTGELLVLRVLMKYYTINLNDAQVYRDTLVSKGKLSLVLKEAKALVTDEFLKELTKNVKEQKQFKKQALEW